MKGPYPSNLVIILIIAWLIVLIYHIVQVLRNPEVPFMMKILWPFIMFIAPVVGIVVYYILGKHERRDDGTLPSPMPYDF